MARNTGDPIQVHDNTSIARYGIQANALGWPHKDLHLVNDADVHALVQHVLNQQKEDFLGVSSVSLDADMDPVHLFGIMARLASGGIGNQATFDVEQRQTSGLVFTQNVHVIGMHGVISMEGKQAKWTMDVRTVQNQGPTISAQPWTDDPPHDYSAGDDDTPGDIVEDGGALYQCIDSHTSGSTTEPGVGVDWTTYWLLLS